jgi:hypothetical protein
MKFNKALLCSAALAAVLSLGLATAGHAEGTPQGAQTSTQKADDGMMKQQAAKPKAAKKAKASKKAKVQHSQRQHMMAPKAAASKAQKLETTGSGGLSSPQSKAPAGQTLQKPDDSPDRRANEAPVRR